MADAFIGREVVEKCWYIEMRWRHDVKLLQQPRTSFEGNQFDRSFYGSAG
jgi:hypothetical protein